MSVYVFVPGRRASIDYLVEQIWFDRAEDKPGSLTIAHVYDVLIRNPRGNPTLDELWCLFDYNCIQNNDAQISFAPLDPGILRDGPFERYDWPFGKTRWGDSKSRTIVREVMRFEGDVLGGEPRTAEGRLLGPSEIVPADIAAHLGFLGPHVACLEALSQINKSLVCIRFPMTPLRECESGWIRMVTMPSSLDAPRPTVRNVLGTDNAHQWDQHVEIRCSRAIREGICREAALHTNAHMGGGSHPDEAWSVIMQFMSNLKMSGTSTRVLDRYVAVVVPTDRVDIHDVQTTTGATDCGILDLHEGEFRGHIWSTGSVLNRERDLIHNAMRVIHRLALSGTMPERTLRSDLSPSGKHEAFSLFVNIMKMCGILRAHKAGEDEIVTLATPLRLQPEDRLPTEDDFDFNRLREVYAREEVAVRDRGLVREFGDDHPFRIWFRLSYLSKDLGHVPMTNHKRDRKYDAFISHATEDKNDFVRPLVDELKKLGIKVWYDDFTVKVGDSLRRSIDQGLANSRYGVVVLSRSFFRKNWPQYELDGLVSREMEGRKVVLPIWHRVTADEVRSYSPTLADRVAITTSVLSIRSIAEELAKVLKGGKNQPLS